MLEMLRIMSKAKTRNAQRAVKTRSCVEPHLDKMARKIEANIDPKLKAINRSLGLAMTQRTATSEHNAINNKAAYRRRVLKMLGAIMKSCPPGHPLREDSVRVLGNVLGKSTGIVVKPRRR